MASFDHSSAKWLQRVAALTTLKDPSQGLSASFVLFSSDLICFV
jgi:hypothetical protein